MTRLPRALGTAVLCLALTGCATGRQGGDAGDRTTPEAATSSATPSPTVPSPSEETGPTPESPSPTAPQLPAELSHAVADGPREATSAGQVAAQLLAAERAIAGPKTRPEVLAAASHLQQLAYRVLARHRAWDKTVQSRLPKDLHRVVADNVEARRQLRSMHPTSRAELSDTLPAWRIVKPAPKGALLRYYREAEREFGIPWEYLAAINLVETSMGRIRGTSVAGAQGPMQFMPPTWAAYGKGDVHDPHDAILGAARYLKAMGFAEDRETALRRYNNHGAYVRAVSLLAGVMERRPRAFDGYYGWQVYYLTRHGSIHLPEGYAAQQPIPVKSWLARHAAD